MLVSTSFIAFIYSNTTLNITNSSTTVPTTTANTIPLWIRIVTLTCMIFIDISAFLGNLLVICAFFRTRRLQTVTNYFIASLAFADALVAIFVLPLSIYCYQRDRSWKLGLILCDLWVSSDVLLCTSSILNLTCISVDRYMAITRPLTYSAYRSKFLARVMILLVWIMSAVITCPPIFGWRDKNRRQTVEEEFRCDLNTARGYVVYSALGSFYIPGVVMIFVYIRIFMVVYDRENLIKKFHNQKQSPNSAALKSPQTNLVNNHIDLVKKPSKWLRLSSCCCFCLRQRNSAQENPPSRGLIPQYTFNSCSTVEQKQNGYLVYRFTSNHNNNNNSTAALPVQTPPSNSKTSIFCHSCTNSTKNLNPIPDDIYQCRKTYLAHIAAEYQFRTDDSPCYELKTFENSLSPLMKCRSRSFEQSATSKIRDLNTELSHSRQLKAAAVAAAAATTITVVSSSTNNTEQSSKDDDELEITNKTSSINDKDDSLNELPQVSILPNTPKYKKYSNHQLNIMPMRERARTNPSIMQQRFSNSPTYPYIMKQNQSLPEPTRINRRIKSSRAMNHSPSALLIENFKQQHRLIRSASLKSTQSSKSLSSVRHFLNINENPHENNLIEKYPFLQYCCCCSSCLPTKSKQTFNYTPNHSLTNEEDDDEKYSSNETSNRTPLYTPIHSSSIPHTNTSSNGTPGDPHRRERIRFMKEQKTAKTLAVVVGGFIILWLPFFIMYVIPPEKHLLNAQTVTLITWLGYFNSVINPFIYAYCSKQFRMAFWNITFGIFIKKSSVLLPIPNKNKQLHQRRLVS